MTVHEGSNGNNGHLKLEKKKKKVRKTEEAADVTSAPEFDVVMEEIDTQDSYVKELSKQQWFNDLGLKATKIEPFGLLVQAPEHKKQRKRLLLTAISPSHLKEMAWKSGFVVFRRFRNLDRDEMVNAAKTIGEGDILTWEFGDILDVKVAENPKTSVTSREHVPFHFDGMYFKIPSFQFFQCLQAPLPDCGGETLMCNSVKLIKETPPQMRKLWKRAKFGYWTPKSDYFGGFCARFPVIDTHPHTNERILRYHEPWELKTEIQPVKISYVPLSEDNADTKKRKRTKDLTEEQQAMVHEELVKRIYSPRYCYYHTWQDGDFVMTDNHGILHGRTTFTENTPRHLLRIHIGPSLPVKEFFEQQTAPKNLVPGTEKSTLSKELQELVNLDYSALPTSMLWEISDRVHKALKERIK